jgi:DNA topoisomerase-1
MKVIMKKLFIVESPTKVKTIKKFLTDDFIVTSTMGHIKDLPKKKIGVSISKDKKIEIDYELLPGKEKTAKEIISLSKKVDIVYLASDPDREGEIIALHTKELIEDSIKNKKNIKIKRIVYNEISKNAITEAIKNARDLNEALIEAQQARRILDRWVGYKVSPVLWKKIAKGLSAGRVQSVALKLICTRENEIKIFKIEEYWTIHGMFEIQGNILESQLIKINDKKSEHIEKEKINEIFEQIPQKIWKIHDIKDTKKSKKPNAPFITSTLQQAAYNRLGFNVQKTMILAQKLYEGIDIDGSHVALITYMRTDSTRIADESMKNVRDYIRDNFGEKYVPSQKNIYSKKGAQDAHEAIRPIDILLTPDSLKSILEKDMYELYKLIWQRFISCQMSNAEYLNRQILISNNSKKEFVFKISGSSILFDGYLSVLRDDDEEEKNLLPPLLEKESELILNKKEKKQHFTQPPSRYTEATLVKELESKKIGRPGTYAAILRTIQDRLYTNLDEKKRFIPTELGNAVIKILEENMPNIINIDFTANMEDQLDKIAHLVERRDNVLLNFYNPFIKELDKFVKTNSEKEVLKTNIKCKNENCPGSLVIKFGSSGEFLGCDQFPTCNFTSNFEKKENDEIILIEQEKSGTTIEGISCRKCNNALVKRNGKYGAFISCSGYPKCSYIHKERTKSNCPLCNLCPLVKNSWKGKVFWGCESYPKCRFSISSDIIEKKCEKCSFNFFKKIKNSESCANKKC